MCGSGWLQQQQLADAVQPGLDSDAAGPVHRLSEARGRELYSMEWSAVVEASMMLGRT